MRVPFRHIAGHLVWSTSGTVWAIWRVAPMGGRHVPARVREEILGCVTGLVRSLPGAPRLFGLAARVDPGELAEQMVTGLDWQRLPAWRETAAASLELLAGQEMHRRTLWLAVPLTASGSKYDLSASVQAMWSELAAATGLPPAPVPEAEVLDFTERAQRVQAALGGGLSVRPASPAEIVWMVQHALHRGLEEPLLADAEASVLFGGQVRDGRLRSPSYADLGQVRLAEGGRPAAFDEVEQPEDAAGSSGRRKRAREKRRPWWRREDGASPLVRRWLQVECEAGTAYQAHLALAELPAARAVEASDVLAQLEGLDFPVDFTVDLQIVPADKAKEQVQRKKRELLDQAEQYGAQPTGMPHSLPHAAGDLAEQDARLSQSSVEVEVQSVTVLTVWGDDPRTCDARARALAAVLSGADYRAIRPHGMQEHLFSLGLPGAARPAVVREFTQHQLSGDWAANGAFTSMVVGDPTGLMVGVDLDCGTIRPVLLNIADAPQRNASASLGIVGDLGAGKSVVEKLLTCGVVDRGGRAIVIDRTPVKEWAAFGRSAAGAGCQVIDAAHAELSIDPLRVFGGRIGAHYALSYLTLQLGVGPMSAAGAVLHHAVEQAAAAPDPSMAHVLQALTGLACDETMPGTRRDAAATMADLIRIVSANPLAAMVFDPALPPVSLEGDLGSDMVVVTTAGLTLPPKEAFANPDVLRQQPLEALIGRAVLYLLAALARQAAFTDPGRFCAIALDECYWLTSSAEGSALVAEILHDGRKHAAGVILGAHNVDELGADAGLLAYKLLARTSDHARAAKGLAFLGLDGESDDLVRLVTTGLSPVGQAGREGEMLLRDPRMQVGRIKVHVPPVPRIQQAIFTTPGAGSATPAEGSVR
ncbi:ATP-binding protein [Actinacidiphila glaucinigra]|uniref:AAA-like domain-containing protein n=1 Tax=Actinacidiphila glaucinigra TaxID=235986 RepID=A0A239LRQ5_9ACTN|nr:ATP-binding protein [Actinacidiphila glaucinigra]SNT33045.1 AAA-like domain-containing protein [Actinacidiphila glaucinigra]